MNRLNRQVVKLVHDTVKECSSTANPNFDEICSNLGLDVKVGILPDGTDGIQKGKTIIINSRVQYEMRIRFTQFHELAHYLIENNADLISELHEYTCNQKNGYKDVLETLCNVGAAEFLMPRKEFMKLYQEKGFNVELIRNAADHFKASTIAAAIQLAQVAPNECLSTVWGCGLTPNNAETSDELLFTTENESYNKPKLHVVYSASSPAAANRWLAKYTTFPKDHLINQAFEQGMTLKDECDIHFPGWKERCSCEVLPYKNRVYALFHLTPPPSPGSDQMILFEDFL